MKDLKVFGVGIGGLITLAGLLLIWPIGGWNITGIIVTLVGLIGFGGFAKGKWY